MVGKDVVVDDDDMATLVPDVSGEEELDDCDVVAPFIIVGVLLPAAVSVAIEPDEAGRDPNAATAGRMKYEERSPLAPELGEAGREGRTSPRWKEPVDGALPMAPMSPDYEFF